MVRKETVENVLYSVLYRMEECSLYSLDGGSIHTTRCSRKIIKDHVPKQDKPFKLISLLVPGNFFSSYKNIMKIAVIMKVCISHFKMPNSTCFSN